MYSCKETEGAERRIVMDSHNSVLFSTPSPMSSALYSLCSPYPHIHSHLPTFHGSSSGTSDTSNKMYIIQSHVPCYSKDLLMPGHTGLLPSLPIPIPHSHCICRFWIIVFLFLLFPIIQEPKHSFHVTPQFTIFQKIQHIAFVYHDLVTIETDAVVDCFAGCLRSIQ